MDEATALARLHARGLISDEQYADLSVRLQVESAAHQPNLQPGSVLRVLVDEPLVSSDDLADRLGVSTAAVDEQLDWLEWSGLVECHRDGRWDVPTVTAPPGAVAVVAAVLSRCPDSPIDELPVPADLLPVHQVQGAVSRLLRDGRAIMRIPDPDDDGAPTLRLLQGDVVGPVSPTVAGRLAALRAVTDAGLVGEEDARAGRAAIRAGGDDAHRAMLLVALALLRGSEVISGEEYTAGLDTLATSWPAAASTTQPVSVGGWGVAILFLGFIGGAIGYFAVHSDDPRRANHIMKWGLIWTITGWGLVYGFLGFGLILAA